MLQPGVFVEIHGLPALPPSTAAEKAQGIVDLDCNGRWGQLVGPSEDAPGDVAVQLMAGPIVEVSEDNVTALPLDAFPGCDLAVGPESNMTHIAQSLCEYILDRGYCRSYMLVSEAALQELLDMAGRLELDGYFSRLAHQFEEGFLGLGGEDVTCVVDWRRALPSYVEDTALRDVDRNLDGLCRHLTTPFAQAFGSKLSSRTHLMLRRPLPPDAWDLEAEDAKEEDAGTFLDEMKRGELLCLLYLGPGDATVMLTGRAAGRTAAPRDATLSCAPCTLLVVSTERYDWSFRGPQTNWLALQCWCLDEGITYEIERFEGTMESWDIQPRGPVPTADRQIGCCAIYNRYAIDANGPMQYWCAFGRAGGDGQLEMPKARWDYEMYYEPDADTAHAWSYYVKHFSQIEGLELFDCKFFGISPGEASVMDPSQRQLCEVAYVALVEAGFTKEDLQRTPREVGMFVGNDHYDWRDMPKDEATTEKNLSFGGGGGVAPPILANRFSYLMNLRGPSMAIDTACSSSLVAVHAAKTHIIFKDRLEACITAGVMTILSPFVFVANCMAKMLSPDGRCFTFNASANGFARCEAIGCMVLKLQRYKAKELDKEYDPDGFYGTLSASNSNQDGRSATMSAPNGPAQMACIQAVLREHGLTPNEIDVTECHGTGTALGDPIEVGSVRRIFDTKGEFARIEPFFFGSIKSNFGHAEGGAGMTGFIKCMLLVMHQEAAQCQHITKMNPHIDFAGFPHALLGEQVLLKGDSCYAGVSSFGFGGTNAHCQAWGKNITTNRGYRSWTLKQLLTLKMRTLPEPAVAMADSSWRNWSVEGALNPNEANVGDLYDVVFSKGDDEAEWVRSDKAPVDGLEFALRGPFSDWRLEPMESLEDADLPGLFQAFLSLNSKGEAEFQVLAEGSEDAVYCPEAARTTSKLARVLGPGQQQRECTWLICGEPLQRFVVEFFPGGRRTSVSWRRVR